MIKAEFWKTLAKNWCAETDGIEISIDDTAEGKKVEGITGDGIDPFGDEIEEILSELGFDDD